MENILISPNLGLISDRIERKGHSPFSYHVQPPRHFNAVPVTLDESNAERRADCRDISCWN